jgi:hypothetical protein
MRPTKMLGLASLLAVSAMVSATSASASPFMSAELCTEHWELNCLASGTSLVHLVPKTGSVGKVLTTLAPILCLGVLVDASALGLSLTQSIHTLASSYTGCGTGSAHDNCTVTVEEEPLAELLKTGLDEGSLTLVSGRVRLQCSNLGFDCKYDQGGALFSAGAQHLTANNVEVKELGGKFFCPDWLEVDGLLEPLEETYVLG